MEVQQERLESAEKHLSTSMTKCKVFACECTEKEEQIEKAKIMAMTPCTFTTLSQVYTDSGMSSLKTCRPCGDPNTRANIPRYATPWLYAKWTDEWKGGIHDQRQEAKMTEMQCRSTVTAIQWAALGR